MYKLFLLCLIFSSILSAQPVYTAYLDADSNEDPGKRDGSYLHPFKYTSELPSSFSAYTEVYLRFFGADSSYLYDPSGSNANILTLKNAVNLKIAAEITSEHPGTAKFKGLNKYKYAMYFEHTTQNVEVYGIYFYNTLDNCIRFQGKSDTLITDVLVRKCYFEEVIGDTGNCAAIRVRYTENIQIDSCTILQKNRPYQVDGIYIEYSDNIYIKGNNIKLEHNADSLEHLDCIQVFHSQNLTAENNYLENATTNIDSNRQGIHVTETSGEIKILNNVIVSGAGSGLLNIYVEQTTDSLHILNNTLIAKNNPGNVVGITFGTGSNTNKVIIKNNIFYKESSGSTIYKQALWIEDVNSWQFTNDILNNNLYWNTNPQTIPTIRFENATIDWKDSSDRFEVEGVGTDPLFVSSTNYSLQYVSKAKNKGAGLLALGVTKDNSGNDRPYWNNDFDIGAYEIEDTQFKIGATELSGNPPPDITHYLKVIDTYWERNSTPSWIISTDQNIDSTAYVTEGNTPSDIDSLYGLEYKWLDRTGDDQDTSIGAGFYQVSNNYNSASFYIDLRDAVQDSSLNIAIRYRGDLGQYEYYKNGSWNHPIVNDTVVRIWDINGGNTHTNNLTSYWQNALIRLEKDDHPYLVWGPYDDQQGLSDYRVYRKNGSLSFAPIQPDISSDTMEYIDESMSLILIQSSHEVRYYVLAMGNWESSLSTDTVDYEVAGHDPGKAAGKFSPVFTYRMEQNYPNPFNPLTKIIFCIEKEEPVLLKVYDILGREVKTLINQVLTPGNHEVIFRGESLASGIYIYRISSGKFSSVKKMQILK
jgi:hypothetical protein